MTRILTVAGFADIAIAPFDASVPFGDGGTRDAAIDDTVRMTFEFGPLSRLLADQPDDIRARASAVVRSAFANIPGERSVMIDGAVDRRGTQFSKLTGKLPSQGTSACPLDEASARPSLLGRYCGAAPRAGWTSGPCANARWNEAGSANPRSPEICLMGVSERVNAWMAM